METGGLLTILRQSIRAVPAMKYALAVAGGAAGLALVIYLTGGDEQSWVKMTYFLAAMVLLFVFAKLVATRTRAVEFAGIALMFAIVLAFMVYIGSFTYKAVGKEAIDSLFAESCPNLSGGWHSDDNKLTLTISQVGCKIETYFSRDDWVISSVGSWDSETKRFAVHNVKTTNDGCRAPYDLSVNVISKTEYRTEENYPINQCGFGSEPNGKLTYKKISGL